MKTCPDCNAPMEDEELAKVSGGGRGFEYECQDCGALWIWEKRTGLRRNEYGDLDVVSFFEARGARRD